MEQISPIPPKAMMKARRSKNAPFWHHWIGGRGGPGVPFILSKIVAYWHPPLPLPLTAGRQQTSVGESCGYLPCLTLRLCKYLSLLKMNYGHFAPGPFRPNSKSFCPDQKLVRPKFFSYDLEQQTLTNTICHRSINGPCLTLFLCGCTVVRIATALLSCLHAGARPLLIYRCNETNIFWLSGSLST